MTSSRLVRSALCAALLAVLALPALAAPAAPPYRMRAAAGVVHVEPTVHAPAWHLRVSGPDGKVGEDTLLDNEPMRIEPKLLGYPRWLDGSYQFELVPILGDRQRRGAGAALAPATSSGPGVRNTGTFRVQQGVIHLAGTAVEASKDPGGPVIGPADQVIPDDLIVQSSICAGFDCVDGESFGADTLRLKENNLRIHFDDTSTSAGFAANDWRLVANDQPGGGASLFAIEDATAARRPFTIEAASPANALYVDSTGNIGLGTSVPVLDMTMSTTDTPAVRFEQTAGGGFTAQTWDIGANEANFFVRDVTGGSRLSLRIRPGAPTSSLDLSADGDIGMGTASPLASLHVQRSTGPVGLRLARTGGPVDEAITAWSIVNETETGNLTFGDDANGERRPLQLGHHGVDRLLRVGVLDKETVEVNGVFKVIGNIHVTGSVGPDYVFAPGFAIPTIREHAEQMWSNRHLPKVGPARVEGGVGVIDVAALGHGMLEELEVAHIYIARLDDTVQALQAQLAERDEQLRQMQEQIEAIQAAMPIR